MTTNPKAPKFRIRRNSGQSAEAGASDAISLKPATEDGFGDAAFPGSSKAETDAVAETAITSSKLEG